MAGLQTPGQRLPLDIQFKGARTYLHGTDILSVLEDKAGPLNTVSFRLHKVVTHGLDALVLPVDDVGNRDLAGLLLSGDADPRRQIGLIEDHDRAVGGRYDYDEASVVAAAEFEGPQASMMRNPDFSFIEQLVALHKVLLQRVVEPVDVQWYFTQLDADRLPTDFKEIRLTVTRRLGIRLVQSKIDVDGQALGIIAFSGVTT